MADGSIGKVKGTVELEDLMSSGIDLLEHKIEALDAKFGGLGKTMIEQAASFFTAEAALDAVKEAAHLAAETLKEITIEGSHAADIEQTFEHLTESAGLLGDTLLEKTREGLHGTVTDMDIMTRVNQNLSVGLKLSADQMETMSKGAFALAKATGGDTASAMDKLSDAMVTGRTRGIALLTGKIDLAAAEEAYAAKLGVTADHLSEQGKQAAIQEAILAKVESATERVGDQTVRLADKLQAAKVDFANFEEELGTAVATSPVIMAGFDGIHDAIAQAFGSDQGDLVKTMAHTIDNVAISVLGFAEYVVDAVGIIGVEWNAAIVVFDSVKAGWDAIGYAGEGALLMIMKGLNAVSFGAFDEDVKNLEKDVDGWYNAMAENQKGIDEHKKAEDEWAVSTGKVKDVIEGVRQKMLDAQKTEGEFTEVIRDNKTAHEGAGSAAEKHGDAEAKVSMTIAMTKEELKKYNEAWKELNSIGSSWEQTLRTIDPAMQKTIRYYLDAGASVDQLAAAFPNLTKVEIDAVKKSEEHAKVEADAANGLLKLYTEYYAKKNALFGTDTEKAVASAEKDYEIHVEELEKKGVTDVEYYDELWDLRGKDIQLAESARLLGDGKSKASLDKKIADAKDYYQFMLDHRDQYHDEDVKAGKDEVDQLQKQRDAWYSVGGQVNDTTAKVKMLDGEILSVKEALDRFNAGNSMTYDLTTKAGVEQYRQANSGMNVAWSDDQIIAFVKAGGNLEQMMRDGVITVRAYGSSVTDNSLIANQATQAQGELAKATTTTAKAVGDATASMVASAASLASAKASASASSGGVLSSQVMGASYARVDTSSRAEWDRLNAQQAALYLANGRVVDSQQQAIIDRMSKITPPGFRDGGVGDFGDGTLAMLHGREAIVPLDKAGALGGDTFVFNVNGTAEESARQIMDIMMKRAKKTRYFGTA